MRISLAIIVKPTDEEAIKLSTALKSAASYVDEIVVTQAGPKKNKKVTDVIKKFEGKESFFKWCDDFAAARNYNFSQATGDWILWMDADDVWKGLEKLREYVQLADKNGVSGIATKYHYKVDKNGEPEDVHWKVMLIKNDGHCEWKGVIHEDLITKYPVQWSSVKDIIRVHTATEEDSAASLRRNIKILEKAVVKEPEEPRHYFYMARCYLGTEEFEKVIEVVAKYLDLSNWKGERYEALNMAGEAYMRMGQLDHALRAHTDATLELEAAPDAYIYKARVYVQKKAWQDAITCLEIAERRDKEATPLKRHSLYDHDLYLLAAVSYLNVGKYRQGRLAAERAYQNRKSPKAKELMELGAKLEADEDLTQHYRKIGEKLIGDKQRLTNLLNSAPEEIKDDPRLLALEFGASEPQNWPENSVAIFCGYSLESWDGETAKTEGVGGSETAVIEIAKRLAKAGKEVVVYCRCDAPYEGKVIDGVRYKNFWQINKEDTFNVLWLWRGPSLLHHKIKARKVIVDMHDVSTDSVFSPEIIKQIDHVFVKTNYHKSLYPSVPEEKFVVVGNGIDMARFKGKATKDPNRVIYTSTPNRGLENILDVWPEIKKELPDAELHIYYGWNTFYEYNKNNPHQMEWMQKMQAKMNQDGIINHGRLGQAELAKHQMQSKLWLYPTEFPEIHCITALEMQAARVYPITTGYAALAETQQSGLKLPGDPKDREWRNQFVKEVVKAANDVSLDTDKGWEYAESCNWDNVTKVWLNHM